MDTYIEYTHTSGAKDRGSTCKMCGRRHVRAIPTLAPSLPRAKIALRGGLPVLKIARRAGGAGGTPPLASCEASNVGQVSSLGLGLFLGEELNEDSASVIRRRNAHPGIGRFHPILLPKGATNRRDPVALPVHREAVGVAGRRLHFATALRERFGQ